MDKSISEEEKVQLLDGYKMKGRSISELLAYVEEKFAKEKLTISPRIKACFY